MVILFGLGSYCKEIAKKYVIPMEEIEVIIDNGLALKDEYHGKVISWKDYLKKKNNYHSSIIVVGSKNRFDEIREEILSSGIFEASNIIEISKWIENFYSGGVLTQYIDEIERCNLRSISQKNGDIPQELLAGAKLLSDRTEALKRIPQEGVAVEIGVAFGRFSEQILEIVKPKLFYAVDIFSDKTKGFWNQNIFLEAKTTHFDWYAHKFSKYIDSGVMKMEKGFSWDVLSRFSDNYFDYIYLDAAHNYESVVKDIEQIVKKLKSGGIVQFNDYTFQDNCGVIPAVNRFVKETESEVLYYCLEQYGYSDLVVRLKK